MILLLRLAARDLVAHRTKSAIIGSILMFATFLAVTGSALLDSIERATAHSVTTSLAGDLQIYSAEATDRLAVFGGIGPGTGDIGEIDDIARVEAALRTLPEVRDVVPMGILSVTVFTDNEIDRVLGDLREAVDRGDPAGIDRARTRIGGFLPSITSDLDAREAVQANAAHIAEARAVVARVGAPEFWSTFAQDPLPTIDDLETNFAPLTGDGRVFYLRAIGTDLAQFGKTFESFYVVDGKGVPEGSRGLMLSKRTYERLLKNKVAREFDGLLEAFDSGKRIAEDTNLSERAARLPRQYTRLLLQLDPVDGAALLPKLQAELGRDGDLPTLIEAFLHVDDATIRQRHAFFYAEIAPLIRLYEIPVGSTVTLRAYTRAGYLRSVQVPVWGTYELRGLEKSDLTSASNLVDLVTWRELYGKMSEDQKAELSGIKAQVGVRDVDAANIEDALFGEAAPAPSTTTPTASFDEFAGVTLGRSRGSLDLDPADLHRGLVLNAAVFLSDPTAIEAGKAKIRALSEQQGLGIQVVDWQEASGLLGQFISVMRGVLYAALFVIFIVGIIIVNNAMVAATLERVTEIGTMRAIGAQRGFVVILFLLESLLLGVAAAIAGATLAAAFVAWLGHVGLPAPAEAFILLFAGPRLYPAASSANLAFGVGSVLVVSVVSAMYPALLAARVRPVVAMQEKE